MLDLDADEAALQPRLLSPGRPGAYVVCPSPPRAQSARRLRGRREAAGPLVPVLATLLSQFGVLDTGVCLRAEVQGRTWRALQALVRRQVPEAPFDVDAVGRLLTVCGEAGTPLELTWLTVDSERQLVFAPPAGIGRARVLAHEQRLQAFDHALRQRQRQAARALLGGDDVPDDDASVALLLAPYVEQLMAAGSPALCIAPTALPFGPAAVPHPPPPVDLAAPVALPPGALRGELDPHARLRILRHCQQRQNALEAVVPSREVAMLRWLDRNPTLIRLLASKRRRPFAALPLRNLVADIRLNTAIPLTDETVIREHLLVLTALCETMPSPPPLARVGETLHIDAAFTISAVRQAIADRLEALAAAADALPAAT